MGFRSAAVGVGAATPANFTQTGHRIAGFSAVDNFYPPGTTTLPLRGSVFGNLPASDIGGWSIRDHTGTVVASGGAVASGSTGVLPIPVLPCGWYRVYFATAGGAYQGGGYFVITRTVSGMTNVAYDHLGDEMLLIKLHCASYRHSIGNAANPSSYIPTVAARVTNQTGWADPFDTARPKPKLCVFHNRTAGLETGVTTAVAALPQIDYWEGANEPGGVPNAGFTPIQQAFYTAVKAGNPTAKVLGPCPVAVGRGARDRLEAFFNAGGGDWVDILSFHTYNAHMGDLILGRRTWDAWVAQLQQHGLHTKPRVITEAGGFMGAEFGAGTYIRQAKQTMLDLLIAEQYGVQKEAWWFFYAKAHGFDGFPSYLTSSVGQPLPAAAMLYTHSQELLGTTWESRLDFGTIDNLYVIGSTYRRSDSTGVVSLMAPGKHAHPVTLHIPGVSSVVVVDCWGNEAITPVADGRLVLPLSMFPTYVRLPADATVTVVEPTRYGTIVSVGATATCTAGSRGSTLISSLTDGSFPNKLWWGSPNEFADSTSCWQSGVPLTTTAPQAVTLNLPSVSLVSKLVVHCPSPWQYALTSIMHATVEAQIDGGWTQVGTIDESPVVFAAPTNKQDGVDGWTDSFWDDRHIWEIDFPPAATTALRVIVTSVSFGGAPTLDSLNAYGALASSGGSVTAGMGTFTPHLALSALTAYGATTVEPPAQEEATTVDFRLLESGEVRMNENGVDPARITGDAAPTEAALTVRIDPDDLRNALGL